MIKPQTMLKKDKTVLSQFIRQTGRIKRERFGKHRRSIQNKTDTSLPINFTLPHHILNDIEQIPLLKVRNSRLSYCKIIEENFTSTSRTLEMVSIGPVLTDHNITSIHIPTVVT